MSNAFLLEGLARVTGATRDDVRGFLDGVSDKLEAAKENISRDISSILHREGSDSDRVDEVIRYGQENIASSINADVLKLVGGIVGAAWGTGLVAAGLKVGATTVALGLGVEVSAVVSVLIGVIAIFIGGQLAFGMLRQIFGRLEAAWQSAGS